MAALPNHLVMSVEEYLQLERSSTNTRYEHIDGHVRMLAGGSADHSTISWNMAGILRRLLHGSPCRVYNSDLKVQLSEKRFVLPDGFVTCDERDRGRIDTVHFPRLIVEVLSPSTEAYDRGRKLSYYRACATIQEYVLVDSLRPAIEVYRRAENDFWTYHAFESGDDVELASLGIHFPLADAYEYVTFPPDESDVEPE
jgi:Uma2 family endonuclease